RIGDADVATRWASASTPGAPSDAMPSDPDWAGGSLHVDDRVRPVVASKEALGQGGAGIGGGDGRVWWALGGDGRRRGGGLRRGRRDAFQLQVGDTVDWWRVEEVEEQRLLRLRAEMRLPGLAWLDLVVEDGGDGETVFRQKAYFHPHGLLGQLYWWSVTPFH